MQGRFARSYVRSSNVRSDWHRWWGHAVSDSRSFPQWTRVVVVACCAGYPRPRPSNSVSLELDYRGLGVASVLPPTLSRMRRTQLVVGIHTRFWLMKTMANLSLRRTATGTAATKSEQFLSLSTRPIELLHDSLHVRTSRSHLITGPLKTGRRSLRTSTPLPPFRRWH
jgi:hypothetical protein